MRAARAAALGRASTSRQKGKTPARNDAHTKFRRWNTFCVVHLRVGLVGRNVRTSGKEMKTLGRRSVVWEYRALTRTREPCAVCEAAGSARRAR